VTGAGAPLGCRQQPAGRRPGHPGASGFQDPHRFPCACCT